LTAALPAWRNPQLIAGAAVIIIVVLLVAGLIAGDYFLTLAVATRTARSIEHARAVSLAKAQAAEVRAGLRECVALHGLAMIRGSHGTSGATYGANLQRGIANVFAKSGCPQLLARYGPHAAKPHH
jgi:hypothetical protein